MIERLTGSGSDLTLNKFNSIINRDHKPYNKLGQRAFVYRVNTPSLFFVIDLFIGFPLAIYWEKNLSFNSLRFTFESKPKPYRHPFEKFRKVK